MLCALRSAPPQAVLQQLVGAGGAGSCHQTHGGLMQEHLGRCRDSEAWVLSSLCPSRYRCHSLPRLICHLMTPLLSTLPCPAQLWRATSVVLPLTQYKPETWRSGRNKEHSTGQRVRARARRGRERQRLPGTKTAPSCLWAWKTSNWVKPQIRGGCLQLENRTGEAGTGGV